MIPLAPRLFVALLTLYLALDLAAPSLPGAFRFDIGDSVEVIRAEGDGLPQPPTIGVAPDPRTLAAPRRPEGQPVGRQPGQTFAPRAVTHHALARSALPASPAEER